MNNNFEQLGISLIMQGVNSFAKDAAGYSKQVGDMNKATQGYSKEADKSKKGEYIPLFCDEFPSFRVMVRTD